MFEFLWANLATIVIAAVLLAIVAAIIAVQVRNKKKGKSSCGCNCTGCPSAGMCHKPSQ